MADDPAQTDVGARIDAIDTRQRSIVNDAESADHISMPATMANIAVAGDSDEHAAKDSQATSAWPRVGTAQQQTGELSSAGHRFRILHAHAKGGLGQVFVALDTELDRKVAYKEIVESHAHDPESRERFLREARVTGALEHPGIVPVYGLGTYADGRPFYAMRFIEGESLKEAINRFHRADRFGRDPIERSAELRKLLARFIDVCNAVEYAHSRGILHRDLKPANVMLGNYGETLVVDWGLAKIVGHPASGDVQLRDPISPTEQGGLAETQLGKVLGTPPYMSPEQAAGRWDTLGPATDIYSLGATLYSLLTGKAPFDDGQNDKHSTLAVSDLGKHIWSPDNSPIMKVLAAVIKGDFAAPKEVKWNTPWELDAICVKAMSLNPIDRYRSPRALADDIERWLNDEPVAFAKPGPWRPARSSALSVMMIAATLLLISANRGQVAQSLLILATGAAHYLLQVKHATWLWHAIGRLLSIAAIVTATIIGRVYLMAGTEDAVSALFIIDLLLTLVLVLAWNRYAGTFRIAINYLAYVLLAVAAAAAHFLLLEWPSHFLAGNYHILGGIIVSALLSGEFLMQASKERTSLLTGWGIGSIAARRIIPIVVIVPLFSMYAMRPLNLTESQLSSRTAFVNELLLIGSMLLVSMWLNRVEQNRKEMAITKSESTS